ncbi:hypothetical protein Tco_0038520 [Tanacetum coccineum]
MVSSKKKQSFGFQSLFRKAFDRSMGLFGRTFVKVRFGEKWCLCFKGVFDHLVASGLRLNMSKSKLMGIYVDADKVAQAARKIGCVTLKTPFTI